MKLKDYKLEEGNHFIAMEYYKLILNRTFLVLITKHNLIGLRVNGMVSIEGGGDPLTKTIAKKMAILDDLENPYSYIKSRYLRILENLNVFSDEILKIDSSNFRIKLSTIKNISHDKRKKWGMGYYPHDGKIYIETKNKKKREFIILGSQSGEEIKNWIERK